MVNAFSVANGVVLGQNKTDAKSNEIQAIPELLNLLDIEGALITIDAMGNKESLQKAVKGVFAELNKDENPVINIENSHGRVEYREAQVIESFARFI